MNRNMSLLGWMALGTGFVTPAQQARLGGIPLWVFLLVALLVIIVAVYWVLHEEDQAAQKQEGLPEVTVTARADAEVFPAVAAPETAESAAPSLAAEPPPLVEPRLAEIKPDDLKLVEGIGPKISALLQAAGIATFAQLAATDVGRLREILAEAGLTALADPTTWPEQAGLAAAGDWTALEALQNALKGGRRV